MTATLRQRHLQRYQALKNERATWEPLWRDVSEHILPGHARFTTADRNRGTRRGASIINSSPRRSSRTLAAGMMAGITSPARPWFRLTTPDASLAEYGPVRGWLYVVEERMRLAYARSNTYNALHATYKNLGGFGTAAFFLEEDTQDALRSYVLTTGQYCLANSPRLQVDTVYRETGFTVAQMVERFGEKACSPRVREAFKSGRLDTWVDVLHVVEPNTAVRPGMLGPGGKRWTSLWLELAGDEQTGVLRVSGYAEFPVLAPRWDVVGEDVYGYGPGMDAIGDCKGLQFLEKRKAQAFDKVVNPPMVGPAALMNQRASILAGDVTYVDVPQGGQRFEPAMTVHPGALPEFRQAIAEHAQRVDQDFFADLWLMLAQSDNPQMTATEVAERHEEKMLQLGPVLERLNGELLDPLIDRTFSILLRNNQFPPPPEELQGQPLKVEYISILAQAQRMLGIAGMERMVGFVGTLAKADPTVLDKVDLDQAVDVYADMVGVPPSVVRSDEVVAQLRAGRRQAEAQAQQMAQAQAVAESAQKLSQTDMAGDNALTRMVQAMGGPAPGPTGGAA